MSSDAQDHHKHHLVREKKKVKVKSTSFNNHAFIFLVTSQRIMPEKELFGKMWTIVGCGSTHLESHTLEVELKNFLRYTVRLRPAKATGDFASKEGGGRGERCYKHQYLEDTKYLLSLGFFLNVSLLLPEIWYLRESQILLLEAAWNMQLCPAVLPEDKGISHHHAVSSGYKRVQHVSLIRPQLAQALG